MLGKLLRFRLFKKVDNPIRIGMDCRDNPVYADFRSDFIVFTGVYEKFSAYLNQVLREALPVVERAIVVDVEEETRAFFMNGYITSIDNLKTLPLPTEFSFNRISIRVKESALTSKKQDLLNFRIYEAVKRGNYSLVVINCPFSKWESLSELVESLRKLHRGIWLKTFSLSSLPTSLDKILEEFPVKNRCFGLGWFGDKHLKRIAGLLSVRKRLSPYSNKLHNRGGFFFVREREITPVPFRWKSGKKTQEGEEFCRVNGRI